MTHVILGAGPAGVNTAQRIRTRAPHARIVIAPSRSSRRFWSQRSVRGFMPGI